MPDSPRCRFRIVAAVEPRCAQVGFGTCRQRPGIVSQSATAIPYASPPFSHACRIVFPSASFMGAFRLEDRLEFAVAMDGRRKPTESHFPMAAVVRRQHAAARGVLEIRQGFPKSIRIVAGERRRVSGFRIRDDQDAKGVDAAEAAKALLPKPFEGCFRHLSAPFCPGISIPGQSRTVFHDPVIPSPRSHCFQMPAASIR